MKDLIKENSDITIGEYSQTVAEIESVEHKTEAMYVQTTAGILETPLFITNIKRNKHHEKRTPDIILHSHGTSPIGIDVPFSIAAKVIEAHIEKQELELKELMGIAEIELKA